MQPLRDQGRFKVGVDRKRRDQKPRVLLSCTSCREKKLKCNRRDPCDNCQKKGQEKDCSYSATKKVSQQSHGTHSDCEARIRNLETRLLQLESAFQNQQSSQRCIATDGPYKTSQTTEEHVGELSLAEIYEPEVMLSESAGSRSFNQNHWRAIMKHATCNIDTNEDVTSRYEPIQTPMLLRGTLGATDMESLLRALPPRDVADELTLRYLDSGESSLSAFLTFDLLCGRHALYDGYWYNNFWDNQFDVSRAWLALLYGILLLGVWIEHSMNPETAEEEPPEIFNYYKKHCCTALISSNYTTPGRYKVEAATLYLGVEYLSSDGLKTSVSILVSMVSRLAIMMGYHRDPQLYPQLSTFEGEMRRRLWLILSMIDYFVAWQSGLPTVIPKGIADTAPPRILFDEDFDANTENLPPSTLDHETSTNISYVIAQERLIMTANTITQSSEAYPSPQRTISFEQQLEAAWSQVPAYLKQGSLHAIDADTMIRILTLEMTYQRARCILHRPYLVNSRGDPAYKLFRVECVHAAQRILHCQIELFQGILSQPQCRHKVWFGISRSICDCLTAAMVISLEILSRFKRNELIDHGSSDELIQTVKASRLSWEQCPRPSMETMKAASILGNMLRLIDINDKRFERHITGPSIPASENMGNLLRHDVDRDHDLSHESTTYNSNQPVQQPVQSHETFTNISAFDMIDFVRPPPPKRPKSSTTSNVILKTLWDQEMQNLSHISTENEEFGGLYS
ncbi:hypothetical protein N7456_010806 [Penicillium angulare]|uniref:Zn(2)-C6 fungal-type domain-containing protein n=1 Tax=Penicillium angulare TaxID=116970 RepID=A0A9W9ESN5_9EURO|nr:hypothetical protein N7456_010806 [Penicillium angulare]